MTLLEMLDVLEGGCSALQQKNVELAAALHHTGTPEKANISPITAGSPKKRKAKAKPKRKSAGQRRVAGAKRKQLDLPITANAADSPVGLPEAGSAKPDETSRLGKRQALGMSFSKLRASIQARRAERSPEHEPEPDIHSVNQER